MSEGNIIFGSINGSGGGGIVVNGARNGLSVDAGGFIVLGNEPADATFPAKLLDNRDVPMDGNSICWNGGFSVFSKSYKGGGGALVEIDDVSTVSGMIALLMNADSTAAGTSEIFIQMNATVPGPVSVATPGSYLQTNINGVQSFIMEYDGQTFWKNPNTGVAYFGISDTQEILGAIGGQACVIIEQTYNTSVPLATFTDIFMRPNFTIAGGSANVVQINMVPIVNQTAGGTGSVTGILFNPGVASITGQLIAYQNVIGDVLLQSNGTTGRTGVHGVATPTAYIHIGAGAAAASSAPIKLTTGAFQTVAELGAIEYNGTNLTFVRTGTTRENILTGNTAAAPGTVAFVAPLNMYGSGAAALTTPTAWAQVNVSGTNYKIPLY